MKKPSPGRSLRSRPPSPASGRGERRVSQHPHPWPALALARLRRLRWRTLRRRHRSLRALRALGGRERLELRILLRLDPRDVIGEALHLGLGMLLPLLVGVVVGARMRVSAVVGLVTL